MQHRAHEVINLCRKLAEFTEEPGHTTRTFLSPPMRDVHRELASRMEQLGMSVTIDTAGNLRGFYPARTPGARRVIIGSHLDTVPHAGAFDGILGVVMGIAMVDALTSLRMPFGIEVIGFSEEEGVRFGIPFIGSRALVGRIDDELLNKSDAAGASVQEAIEQFGLNLAEIQQDVLDNDACAYLEFHIEQGPVLENVGRALGVVGAIAGQTRMDFVFTGLTNHAGTTPMNLRFDAMAGAAEWIIAVERTAKNTPGLVATVGSVETRPGATNVIA